MISINFLETYGKIKPMNAVNNGPAGSVVRQTGNDAAFAAARIPYARNHDAAFYAGYGGDKTVDVHRIFRNFDADENDPASYDFKATDAYVKRVEATGTHMFYRLGAAIEHQEKCGTYPPKDFMKWARICEHIIRHYNEGWADGFAFGIEYWEIWNEPDCCNPDGTNPCWQGTNEQFVEFFCTVLPYLKGKFPSLKIGGPAFCAPDGVLQNILLSEMQKRGITMDFYSYHCYTSEPENLLTYIKNGEKILEKYGFAGMETILNEWNYNCGWLGENFTNGIEAILGLKGASYAAACMSLAQASSLGMLMYYDARPSAYNGLFKPYTLKINYTFYPFKMFGDLAELGNAATVEGLEKGLYAVAATNGKKHALMLTRYLDTGVEGENAEPIEISLGLEKGKKYAAKAYVINEQNKPIEIEASLCECGKLALSCPMYSVAFVEIEEI
jgi:hypothetical protein